MSTAYQKAQERIAYLSAKVEELKPHFEAIEKVRDCFPAMKINTSFGIEAGQLQGALLMIEEVEDIRDVVPVCKMLVALGYHTKGHSDFPEIRRRTYDYGPIQVSAFLKYEDGAKCEFKQVGTKEEPVYELVCK